MPAKTKKSLRPTLVDRIAQAHDESRFLAVEVIKIDELTLHPQAQPRTKLDTDLVDEYAEGYLNEVVFPPIVAFRDGDDVIVADGFHRVKAAEAAGEDSIRVRTYDGTLEDAIAYALTANAEHGARRTNKDKVRAVEIALTYEDWAAGVSDNALAQALGVSQPFVSKVRRDLEERGLVDETTIRTGTDGREVDITETMRQPTPIIPEAEAFIALNEAMVVLGFDEDEVASAAVTNHLEDGQTFLARSTALQEWLDIFCSKLNTRIDAYKASLELDLTGTDTVDPDEGLPGVGQESEFVIHGGTVGFTPETNMDDVDYSNLSDIVNHGNFDVEPYIEGATDDEAQVGVDPEYAEV